MPYNWPAYLTVNTVRYKILEGENFGETVHTKIIFWQMPKIVKAPNNNYVLTFSDQL